MINLLIVNANKLFDFLFDFVHDKRALRDYVLWLVASGQCANCNMIHPAHSINMLKDSQHNKRIFPIFLSSFCRDDSIRL